MSGSTPATLTFLGAAGTVTGSKHLVSWGDHRVLLDCGLFQGLKRLRLRNWAPLPEAAARPDAVVLSHAHLDHSGYLPLLAKNGFAAPVHCTPGTADLLALLLRDSAHIQERDAARANRHGYSKPRLCRSTRPQPQSGRWASCGATATVSRSRLRRERTLRSGARDTS